MKNSIKCCLFAAIALTAASCLSSGNGSVSYTLVGEFNYIAENPTIYKLQDSLIFANKVQMGDGCSMLCTKCDGINENFDGGWKISTKKGSPDDTEELSMFTSAGKNAGLTITEKSYTSSNKAYAVFCQTYDMPAYDITFEFSGYSKSTCYVIGFYINNTKYVENLADAGQIPAGDFLKVTATFYKNGAPVGTEEKFLVDNTGTELKIVKDWEEWKMEDVTKTDVDAVKFSVESGTGVLGEGFCLDNFVASIALEY